MDFEAIFWGLEIDGQSLPHRKRLSHVEIWADVVSNLAQVVLISDDIFSIQGSYRVTDQHFSIEVAAYVQINAAVKKVWNKLLSLGGQIWDLT